MIYWSKYFHLCTYHLHIYMHLHTHTHNLVVPLIAIIYLTLRYAMVFETSSRLYVSGLLSQGEHSKFVCHVNYSLLVSGDSTLLPASYSFGAIGFSKLSSMTASILLTLAFRGELKFLMMPATKRLSH